MAEPRRFASAQRYALGVAFLAYAATGAGVARLYDGLPCAPDGVAGNVLDDLPRGAPWTTAPSAVRVAMSVVCVFSAPIGVVSSGEILEAALPPLAPGRRPLFLRRLAVRGGVAFGAATVAAAVPVFALIVALASAFTVTAFPSAYPALAVGSRLDSLWVCVSRAWPGSSNQRARRHHSMGHGARLYIRWGVCLGSQPNQC